MQFKELMNDLKGEVCVDWASLGKKKLAIADGHTDHTKPASTEGQKVLQAAYDRSTLAIKNVRAHARSLAQLMAANPKKKSDTVTSTMKQSMKEAEAMESTYLPKMSRIMVDDVCTSTDEAIKSILHEMADPYAKLKLQESALMKLMADAKKRGLANGDGGDCGFGMRGLGRLR